MRIALVAPLFESVPPKLYGGTERVVHYLEGALVALGHEVHVFASGDSEICGTLHPTGQRALRLDTTRVDLLLPQMLQLDDLIEAAGDFDIVHFHSQPFHFPFAKRMATPNLTTLHGRLDLEEMREFFYGFRSLAYSSISHSQRQPLPFLNWQATVLHGLPENLLRFSAQPGKYLAFLGRISPEKRVDRAIEIARLAGLPIKIAAKIDKADEAYFRKIAPLFQLPHVEYVGEISDAQKSEFLGNALALLFPIDWPEPFGLVMLEAMATGTPVIAYRNGSVPEVIRPGVSGFIIDNIAEAVSAVEQVSEISRFGCRHEFERHFSARRMAENYVKVYKRLAHVESEEESETLAEERAEAV